MKTLFSALACAAALAMTTTAYAQSIEVLSAGAVEPGILAAADAFKKSSGTDVKVRFATAPAILKQMAEGAKADVVIAPPPVLDELAKTNKIDAATRKIFAEKGVE